MRIGEVCTREVVVCDPATTALEAARLMREYHVGCLVITEQRDGRRFPTGVITDRDLVISVLALEVAPTTVTAGDMRTRSLVAVPETEGVFDTLELMRRKGVRRLPVTDAHGALVGIATLDDLLEIVAEQLATMVRLISRARLREKESRPPRPGAPATRAQPGATA